MPGECLDEELTEHEAIMKTYIKKHESAMQATRDKIEEMKAAMQGKILAVESQHVLEMSAAMQLFETKVAACRVYHEAPNDVFELIVFDYLMWARINGGVGLEREA
jgi:hypothetical protein